MSDLNLVAVGSSPLVAEEIREITKNILAVPLPITTRATKDIAEAEPHTFYVCATTQGSELSAVIPKKQLYVFFLEPTTKFFLDIAKIPAGETVYVFNNLLAYTEILIKRCRELGMTNLNFEPIAYDEMDGSEVKKRLQQAKYIVGVDVFVGKNVLQSDAYKQYLRDDVQIIAGTRTASVASANRLLAAIGAYYYREYMNRLYALADAKDEVMLKVISHDLGQMLEELQQSVLQTVTSQVGSNKKTADEEREQRLPLNFTGDFAQDFHAVETQLQELAELQHKIEKLVTESSENKA